MIPAWHPVLLLGPVFNIREGTGRETSAINLVAACLSKSCSVVGRETIPQTLSISLPDAPCSRSARRPTVLFHSRRGTCDDRAHLAPASIRSIVPSTDALPATA